MGSSTGQRNLRSGEHTHLSASCHDVTHMSHCGSCRAAGSVTGDLRLTWKNQVNTGAQMV